MAISVVCPSCFKRFHVSDKFAGKSGPCPKCKAIIQVPAAEVIVHAPEEFASGGRTVAGKLATRPIARTEVKLQPLTAAIIAALAILIVLAAWAGGRLHLFDTDTLTGQLALKGYVFAALGLLVVSPLLVIAPYTFLRDEELEPYRGKALYVRAGACALGYAVLWAMLGYVIGMVSPDEPWSWVFIGPPFLAVGGLIPLATLDLDYGSGFFHYSFYLLATILLRWIAGMGWVWDVKG
jgi:hypothetical protein